MKKIIHALQYSIERVFSKMDLGMRAKLIIIFVIIKVIPLLLLTFMAWRQAVHLGDELNRRTQELTVTANKALAETGNMAVEDSVKALNNSATEQIERTSTDTARRVADFLYDRDRDILYAAALEPDEDAYRRFLTYKTGALIKKREWVLAGDGKSWVPVEPLPTGGYSPSTNPENDTNYHNLPQILWETEERPLYLEMTYVDLNGNERIKITTSNQMSAVKKNVASRLNTYVKAETYFADLKNLRPGEIYVSEVIGAYVRSRLIGMYTPENAGERGLEFAPEEEAYAGRENPNGRRFKGIIRWAAPVVRNGAVAGYVTLALDHDHIMEFTDHITPMNERYVEMPSAYEGNYAFIWDYKCRSICHPRHHSIVGYNPETGEPEIPWLEEDIYKEWQASGLPYVEFIKDTPVFEGQSRNKRPAPELTAAGLVGLDGRYLNNAPQCIGWFDLTKEGGSGSFLILWSGIWKPNTAATIPYYTGRYGTSKRGFGFVAIGAGLEDFQRPARQTEAALNSLITNTDEDLSKAADDTRRAITSNLINTTLRLVVSAGLMILLVVLIAIWMASVFTESITNLIRGISRFRSGERLFRFNAGIKDEIGTLADSFDEMADSLVESDRGPLIITDMDGLVIYANEMALEAINKDLSSILGAHYGEVSIYPPDSEYDPVYALREGREPKIFYLESQKRHFKGAATYLTSKDGKNIGYIITSSDVTEIIEQQKKTAEQKTLLDTVFASSPDLIWYQDPLGRFLAANPRYAAFAGVSPLEIAGRNSEEIIPPDYLGAFTKSRKKAVESKQSLYIEENLRFADGHEEVLDTVIAPIFGADGGLMGILGYGRDVSARDAIEKKLRSTQLELEKAVLDANQANAHKGDFLARMSHEIRTPMNAIIGMTGIVRKKLSDPLFNLEQIQADVHQIEISSQHLLGLLNDILDISKIEAGKIEISEEAVDFFKLADTVAAIIRPRCGEKNILFNTRFNLTPPALYVCDSLRLRQVLINLLGNAVKFTPEHGTIDFTIAEKEKAGNKTILCFSVRDTGIGIPEAALSTLFLPFEQANSQIFKRYGGTGLGLAISRSIVQLFGGDIVVSTKEGEGSLFSFELALASVSAGEEENLAAEDAAGKLSGRRALLVDDVSINRVIAMNLLEHTGMAIDEADDGVTAVKMFAGSGPGTYDIIYMDVQMPNMSGYEASRAIRALERSDAKTVPIVAVTANAFKDDIEKAIQEGMNAHLAKPMDAGKLIDVTLRLLGLR
ncbi:MAG: response regulator [Spirochaetaceae bacterium]|jgi:PAS domain S-box-containing protein|nr:response regulator [Spirochaetaceae bacterium]